MADLYLKRLETERKALWATCRLKGFGGRESRRNGLGLQSDRLFIGVTRLIPAAQFGIARPELHVRSRPFCGSLLSRGAPGLRQERLSV